MLLSPALESHLQAVPLEWHRNQDMGMGCPTIGYRCLDSLLANSEASVYLCSKTVSFLDISKCVFPYVTGMFHVTGTPTVLRATKCGHEEGQQIRTRGL